MIIKTKQFVLRPYRMSDADDLAKKINDWRIIRNLALQIFPYKKSDALIFLKKTLPNYKIKNPGSLVLGIEIDGKIAGSVGLHKIEPGHQAEIGYWLAPVYWGNGIMTNVVKKTTAYGFKKFKLKRIYAKVFIYNPGSKIVLEKNGFKLEGILKKAAKKKGKFIDEYLLAKVK
ncbi:MAG: GNAT family protein [Candidatus Parcubacteria bacterium]|nr:GNAT family protein [Candidatus Parcubacteria bacterium]